MNSFLLAVLALAAAGGCAPKAADDGGGPPAKAVEMVTTLGVDPDELEHLSDDTLWDMAVVVEAIPDEYTWLRRHAPQHQEGKVITQMLYRTRGTIFMDVLVVEWQPAGQRRAYLFAVDTAAPAYKEKLFESLQRQ